MLRTLYMAQNISRCAQGGNNIGHIIGNHLVGCLPDIIFNKYSTFAAAQRLLYGRRRMYVHDFVTYGVYWANLWNGLIQHTGQTQLE